MDSWVSRPSTRASVAPTRAVSSCWRARGTARVTSSRLKRFFSMLSITLCFPSPGYPR